MSDFSEKVNDLLSNPEALAQIMKIAQSLGLGAPAANTAVPNPEPATVQTATFSDIPQPTPQPKPAPQAAPTSALPKSEGSGLSSLASMLSGGGGLGSLSAISGLLGGGSGDTGADKRVALLRALKPFMKDGKQKKVDNVLSAITISSALGKMRNV